MEVAAGYRKIGRRRSLRPVRGLENIPDNATALGIEQLLVDLNGGVEGGMIANVNNPTVKQIYIEAGRAWLDSNISNWEQIFKFQ